MIRHPKLVQIHLGESIPSYLIAQLSQTRLLNPKEEIFLLLDRKAEYNQYAMEELGIRVFLLDRLEPCENHRLFLKKNRFAKTRQGQFWRFAFERFLVMESFLEACPVEDVIHLENDVMLYASLSELLPPLRLGRGGIQITMDSDRRCIPGFVYIKQAAYLSEMNHFLVQRSLKDRKTDMAALAFYLHEAGEPGCSALPVIPKGYRELYELHDKAGNLAVDPWYDQAFESFRGVFDAAALGQFLGGIDKIHNSGDTRGFINETAVYNASKMGLHWKRIEGLARPFGKVGELEFPIFNLHIHSKQLSDFSSKNQEL